MEPEQISALPYDRRRMIVVGDEEVVSPAYSIRRRALLSGSPSMHAAAAIAQAGMLLSPALWLLYSKAKVPLLAITRSEAAALRFPVGHPRRKVVYVGHPIDPVMYIPMAHFHTFLFEHKVAEALRLLRSLGADSVEVVRVEGWDRSVGIELSAPLPGAEQVQVGASAGFERGHGQSVMAKMRLEPTAKPGVPNDLVWLPNEPLWQEVVDARLTSGLRSFVLDVRSFDDYGVNAHLKALIAKSGLEMGGSFVEHRATLWRLEGTFANQ